MTLLLLLVECCLKTVMYGVIKMHWLRTQVLNPIYTLYIIETILSVEPHR